jgi:hypothetical protein
MDQRRSATQPIDGHRRRTGLSRFAASSLALVVFSACTSTYRITASELERARSARPRAGYAVPVPAIREDGEHVFVNASFIRGAESLDDGIQVVSVDDNRRGYRIAGWTSLGVGLAQFLGMLALAHSDANSGREALTPNQLTFIAGWPGLALSAVGIGLILGGYLGRGPEMDGPVPEVEPTSSATTLTGKASSMP